MNLEVMMAIARSGERVAKRTSGEINEKIRQRTRMSLAYFANHREQIGRRLEELDQEWDVERALETGSSALTLTGLVLGTVRARKWLLLSVAVQGFFMQHALQGWCPPLPVFRSLGFRTRGEIDQERYALKALRGDFAEISQEDADSAGAAAAFEAVRR